MRSYRPGFSMLVLGILIMVGSLNPTTVFAQSTPPKPDHVVVLIEENHDYSQINGSASAPYINSLKTQGAWFTNSHAIEHPSQPNYLDLYSGSNQGVTDDTVPPPTMPAGGYTVANLGGGLKAKSFTFGGYSETMPSVGFTGGSSGTAPNTYQRKHNPWVDWQGTGTNQIPSSWNMPFAGFFPTDFTLLPTVSIVVPNQNNDMHDGTISTADTWAKNNLDAYVQWAKTHNSLFILTFDENNGGGTNQIVTVFVGQMVKAGQYGENVSHYTVLRTIEDMYGLAHAGAAGSASPILDCWTTTASTAPSITSQPANHSVAAGQTATFSVGATGSAPLSYQWQKQAPGSATWTNVGANSSSYTTPATLLSDSGTFYRVVVSNGVAPNATSSAALLTVTSSGNALPSPWVGADIGSPGLPGSASYSGGTFTLSGSGSDIWGTADAFQFVYQSLTGDGEILAQVTGLGNTDPWAKAGVMIRESLAAGSANAAMLVTPGNGTTFQRRTATGAASTSTAGTAATVPIWVRLVRSGNTLTGYASADGVSWTLVGSDTISMSATVLIGLVVTSHNNALLDTAMVDSVAGSGGWQAPSGGGPSPSGNGGSGGGGGGCGATGLECLLVLCLVRPRRRTPDYLRL